MPTVWQTYHYRQYFDAISQVSTKPYKTSDKLIRLRSNLCLWTAPPSYSGIGRPRLHGNKFKLNDSTTWTAAIETIELDHPQLGQLRISLWKDLHFQAASQHPMQLIRVERIDKLYSWKMPKPLWLVWLGSSMPPLAEIWQLYLRRFGVDHWYRLARATSSLDFTKVKYTEAM